MTNILDSFPSNYLKAADLQRTEPIVAIDRVVFEPVGDQKEMKGVLYFIGKKKGIVLNKTNAKKIVEITGTAITEQWRGVRIKLYTAETTYKGDTVDCIRIKPVAQTAPTPAPAPPAPAPIVSSEFLDSPMPAQPAPETYGLEPVARTVPMLTGDDIPF